MVLFGLTRASVRGRALRHCDGNRCGGGVDRRGLGSRKRLPALRTSREHGPVQVLPAVVASRLTAKPCLRSVWREFLERTIVAGSVAAASPGFKRPRALPPRLLCGYFHQKRGYVRLFCLYAATFATGAVSISLRSGLLRSQ